MADKKKTVEIIFGGVDKTGKAVSSVGNNLNSLSDHIGSISGPLAGITDNILQLDTALAAAAAGLTGYAIKLSDDFDTAFGEIATLIGQPADNLRDFQGQILEYSERSTASLEQITGATYGAISAGVDYQSSLELIAAAEELAIAGKADLGETTTALVSVMNAFGASADEAGAYADDFFTAVQLGQTTIPELSGAIGRLAPIAAAAGLDFKEMAAAIATITAETGSSTAETITGIRAAISSILKPTKEATDVAADLGLEFNATALESQGFAGFMEQVAEKTGGSTELLTKLFGSLESLTPVLSLTGNASEAFADNLERFQNNAGASSTAAQELSDKLGRLGQTLVNNLESALIGVGGRLTDETRSIVQSLTSMFNTLGDEIQLSDGAFAPILGALEGLAQDVDQKLRTIAENFPEALSGVDVTPLLSALRDLQGEMGEAFESVFGEVDLSTVEGLQEVLQKVVDAFTALTNVTSGIVDGLAPLFAAIGKGIEEFQDLDSEAQKTVGELLGLAKAVDTLLPVLTGLADGIGAVGSGLTALAGASAFKALIGNLGTLEKIGQTKTGKGGLIGFALTGGYAIGTLLNETVIEPLEDKFGGTIGGWLYEQFNADEMEKIKEQFAPLTEEQKKTAKETANLRELNNRLADSLDNTKQAAELDIEALNKRAEELVKNSQAQDTFNDKLEDYTGSQRKATNAIDALNDKVSKSGGSLKEVGRTTTDLAKNNKTLVLGYDEATGKVNSWSGAVVRSNQNMESAADKTTRVIEETERYGLELEKLQSNERIKFFEAKVGLDIAEVEANADKVVALAEAISQAFSDSTGLIGDLFGGFDDASRSTQIELEKQIRKENKLREDQFELLQKKTEAEIDWMKERTRALSRGDAMIKINGEGLAPHLEAFMFEILDNIQARVNAEGEEMLLALRE